MSMKKLITYIIFYFLLISNIVYANIVDELTELNNLYKEGAITKEEFSKAKKLQLRKLNNVKKNL